MSLGATIDANLIYGKTEQRIIIDKRVFEPHQIKEYDVWDFKKFRKEKYFVQLDCKTNKMRKWKARDLDDLQ